ncbi:class I SAM-dependent DNA methyltransferase [Streptomyces griseomycini]|uniref:SAM-dependent methyltransferase n=1 Tax=Streptomyces griseomycini TaxID=66895 RepID=A0A7W7PV98_9ACTN|nr:class I SAM-dependent methyltransferase [Streptomyces griseomycini]MBB4901883.1 SAM-dependent methyltransferase [Streptomyces griseomycini]GGQ17389.1 putative methyltransferase YqeM [Streptomyces griseomycini]GGR40985.1 putative methyltransferase YqeM [Streptomyces griseomycini]
MSPRPEADDGYGAPYSALAQVYDRWMAADRVPYDQWLSFAKRRFAESGLEVRSVLDVCCGTGMTIKALQDHGYEVTGVDASAPMLDIARTRTAPGTELLCLAVPDERLAELGPFDAALVCFDGVNYLTGGDALTATLHQLARALRPGGVLVFDLSTRRAFEEIAALGEFGEDFGDFAYIWKTRHKPDTPAYEYLVSLFVPEGELFRRSVEQHAQRHFTRDEVGNALRATGFTDIAVSDDYTEREATDTTRRETWSARRTIGSTPR